MLLLLVSFIMCIILLFLKKSKYRNFLTHRDIILSITIFLSMNIVFFTHLPVTADRSVSVFLLGHLNDNSDKAMTKEEMTDFFVTKYVKEYGAIERRLHEQIVSGNVERIGDSYKLTSRGKLLVRVYDVIGDLFGVNKKFISPRYQMTKPKKEV